MRPSVAPALLFLAAPLAADTPAPGFSSSALPNGGPIYKTFTLSDGRFVGLSGSSVRLFSESGALLQVLHTFASFQEFPAAIAVDPAETFVIVSRDKGAGEGGTTHRVELTGGPAQPLGPGPVEWVVFEDQHSALYSSVTGEGGWSLFRVDVDTGTFVELADESAGFVGGPIALDENGNLYLYEDASFDGSEGSSFDYVVERFLPSQFAAPGMLVPGQGVTVYQTDGFPLDLELSADGSTLFTAELLFSEGRKILAVPLGGNPPQELVSVAPGEDLWEIQALPGTPPAAFLAYQPASGGELVYQTEIDDDWQRKSLTPARPVLALSGPGTTGAGAVDLSITGGPPNGQALVFRGPLGLFNPSEVAYVIGGIPIFIGLDRETAVKVPGAIPLDASGNAVRQFNNASGATGVWAIQAMVLDAGGPLVGSTTAAFL